MENVDAIEATKEATKQETIEGALKELRISVSKLQALAERIRNNNTDGIESFLRKTDTQSLSVFLTCLPALIGMESQLIDNEVKKITDMLYSVCDVPTGSTCNYKTSIEYLKTEAL